MNGKGKISYFTDGKGLKPNWCMRLYINTLKRFMREIIFDQAQPIVRLEFANRDFVKGTAAKAGAKVEQLKNSNV